MRYPLYFVALCLTLTLLSCAHSTRNPAGTAPVSIVYQSNRYADIEPCTCQSAPWGGVDRELNALIQLKKESPNPLIVEAGNSLVHPETKMGTKAKLVKAKAIVEILNTFGTEVFTPGPGDIKFSFTALKELEKNSQFPWVATNLVLKNGRPAFKSHALITKGKVRIAVLSYFPVSAGKSYKTLKVLDPKKALEKSMAGLKGKVDLFVVTSFNQKHSQDLKTLNSFQTPSVWLGTDKGVLNRQLSWLNKGKVLLADSGQFGRYLSQIKINVKKPVVGFQSSELIKKNAKRIEAVQKGAANSRNKVAQKRYQKRLAKLKAANLQLAPVTGASEYSHQVMALTKEEYGKTQNELSKKMKEIKANLKKVALGK